MDGCEGGWVALERGELTGAGDGRSGGGEVGEEDGRLEMVLARVSLVGEGGIRLVGKALVAKPCDGGGARGSMCVGVLKEARRRCSGSWVGMAMDTVERMGACTHLRALVQLRPRQGR